MGVSAGLSEALQVCDDFLDELLSQDAGGEARVPDIRCGHRILDKPVTLLDRFPASGGKANSASMFDFMVKEEPLGEDDLRVFTKDRVKKDNHNMSKCHLPNPLGPLAFLHNQYLSCSCDKSRAASVFPLFTYSCGCSCDTVPRKYDGSSVTEECNYV